MQGQTQQKLSQTFHTFFPEFTSPRLCASCFKIVSITNGNSEKLRTQFYWVRLCEACTIPTYTGDVLHIIEDQLTAQTMQWTWWVIGGKKKWFFFNSFSLMGMHSRLIWLSNKNTLSTCQKTGFHKLSQRQWLHYTSISMSIFFSTNDWN